MNCPNCGSADGYDIADGFYTCKHCGEMYNEMPDYQHFHLCFTEHNGEQHYTYDYILTAKDEDEALAKSKEWLKTWYESYDEADERVWNDDDVQPELDIVGTGLSITIEDVILTSMEKFKDDMVNRYSFINYEIPKEVEENESMDK